MAYSLLLPSISRRFKPRDALKHSRVDLLWAPTFLAPMAHSRQILVFVKETTKGLPMLTRTYLLNDCHRAAARNIRIGPSILPGQLFASPLT